MTEGWDYSSDCWSLARWQRTEIIHQTVGLWLDDRGLRLFNRLLVFGSMTEGWDYLTDCWFLARWQRAEIIQQTVGLWLDDRGLRLFNRLLVFGSMTEGWDYLTDCWFLAQWLSANFLYSCELFHLEMWSVMYCNVNCEMKNVIHCCHTEMTIREAMFDWFEWPSPLIAESILMHSQMDGIGDCMPMIGFSFIIRWASAFCSNSSFFWSQWYGHWCWWTTFTKHVWHLKHYCWLHVQLRNCSSRHDRF